VAELNYNVGARKGPGDTVKVNEFSGLDPDNLPQEGDWVLLKTRAHHLVEVRPSRTKPDTVAYDAVIYDLADVPAGSRTFDSMSLLRTAGED
jgi:hypothetical protein